MSACRRARGYLTWLSIGLVIGCGSDDEPEPGNADSGHTAPITGTVSANGAELYYEEKGEGVPVILLHGLTLDTRMWDAQFEVLARSYRVIRFDARGHGRSSGAGERDDGQPATYSQQEDLRGFLDARGLDGAHIVGLSMGGFTAYEFAVAHPGRALSLTLIDSAWRFDLTRTSDFQTRAFGYFTNPDLEAAIRAWLADPLFVPANENPGVKDRLHTIVFDGTLALGRQSFLASPFNAVPPTPLAETRLSEIAVPTLVLVGERDDPEFRDHSEFLANTIPGAEKHEIPGAGHMSAMEAPDDVTARLRTFLDAQ